MGSILGSPYFGKCHVEYTPCPFRAQFFGMCYVPLHYTPAGTFKSTKRESYTHIVPLELIDHGFGYIIIRSPYTPYSIYLRGTLLIYLWPFQFPQSGETASFPMSKFIAEMPCNKLKWSNVDPLLTTSFLLNIWITLKILNKGRGFINQGSGLGKHIYC